MKLLTVISAGLVATAVLAAAPASADRHDHGHGWKNKRVCKTVRHHGHQHTVCRNVRVRW